MVETVTVDSRRCSVTKPMALAAMLLAIAAILACRQLELRLPPERWIDALFGLDISDDGNALVAHYVLLPRMAVALMSGAALALAGTICQQVLRNRLAEPTTLGVSAGAHLALLAATFWAPGLLAVIGREGVAMAGASAALIAVFWLAWSRALAPLALILAGLIVSLYCGAFGAALALFHHDYLRGIFIWGAGELGQQDWSIAAFLAPRLALAAVAVAFLVRPLTLLGLDDDVARNLGLGLSGARLAALGVAVVLSASVVSAVGMLGFVGLAAPSLVWLAGARRLRDRLVWAPFCGAGLLWVTDQLVQLLPRGYHHVPTGAVISLIGAPMLLWLLPRLGGGAAVRAGAAIVVEVRRRQPLRLIAVLVLVLLFAVWISLAVGQGSDGWHWLGVQGIQELWPWRAPRLFAALAAGVMLAFSGVMLQRLTGNPMAAPEVLGISSGAALGVILLLFTLPTPDRSLQMLAGAVGAFGVLVIILMMGRRAAFSPDRLLLAGVATSAVFGAVVALAMATGDPRVGTLLTWMAGSTYQVDTDEVLLPAGFAVGMVLLSPLLARWLEILPLGSGPAAALGVNVPQSRLVIMVATAVPTAIATLLIGPLSFVGLMAPHIARMMGLHRALHQVLGAVLIGALIMVIADWIGRTILFPFQVPAGLLATVIGGPYLMWLLRARP